MEFPTLIQRLTLVLVSCMQFGLLGWDRVFSQSVRLDKAQMTSRTLSFKINTHFYASKKLGEAPQTPNPYPSVHFLLNTVVRSSCIPLSGCRGLRAVKNSPNVEHLLAPVFTQNKA